ncbi:MAG: acyl-CoA dehydrogenase family protein [Methyloligellaceae bacterium]
MAPVLRASALLPGTPRGRKGRESRMDMSKLSLASRTKSASDSVAPDCHGLNFFDIDRSLRELLTLYLPDDLRAHMLPHYHRLGQIAGDQLDTLARLADRHAPILHTRDAMGRNEDWIEFHPAYREMEKIGFGEFGMACMSRRPGVLEWPDKVPPAAKYVFQYIFGQSEFGLLCPISATETTAMMLERYGDETIRDKLLERLWSQDLDAIYKGAQFMTEKTGGSDVSGIELSARQEEGEWRLYGEKWFCSCADADVALLLARPEGAPAGNAGLGLFALPRRREDGSRNSYRIVRLKEKLGTRSMASGEIIFEGATAYALGDVGAKANTGLKMMMDQVNLSRLSHGFRAAAMMRRCLNEALVAARSRQAFGETIIDKPLLRRQLMKLMLPTEQALSVAMFTATQLQAAGEGDEKAQRLARILTPILKFRACRDNITVATGAMEVRGGNGYIEDWVNARLARDAHLGVLWEGTSNINALDVTNRAIAVVGAHRDLGDELQRLLRDAEDIPGQFRGALMSTVGRAVEFAEDVGTSADETLARQAADALYHATSASLFASEASKLGARGGDARRLLLARMVADHRLSRRDPLSAGDGRFDTMATDLLLADETASLKRVSGVLAL